MSPILNRRPTTTTEFPAPTQPEEPGLLIVVIFTTADATVSALKRAGTLAERLGARISVVYPQVVPFPLPLTNPPVQLDFLEKRFRDIVAESPVDTDVRLYLCRDDVDTLKTVLKPGSIVVIGGRKCWWPTREQRLARKLRKYHEVIFSETG